MAYKCANCKRTVEVDYQYSGVRCVYCGHRVLVKDRPTSIKHVKAR